jgi:hypothetical protein
MTLVSEQIDVGNHTIAVYSDTDHKIQETLKYLKKGLERNEALIFITDEQTKDQIRERIERDWGVDVRGLESKGDLLLQTPEEWYFKESKPNFRRTDAMFLALQAEAIKRGKSGLRGAGDTAQFFKRGFVPELVEYESSLERHFNITFTPLCTYSRENFDKLTSDQIHRLRECHYHFVVS